MLGYLGVLWKLRRRRDEFVVGFWPQDNIALLMMFLFAKSRVIVAEHISWHFAPRWVRALRRITYKLAWRVIVLNEADFAHFSRFLGNVRLIPNAVPRLLAPAATKRGKLFLAVGHLSKLKNFADAVRAMAMSGLEEEGWHLAIVGDGVESEHLHALIGELGLRNTSIHPATSDIASWYARASVLLVTSRIEVFSLVTAEAALGGAVPLAYSADGPAYILRDFPEQLVSIGDVAALAARMRRLADNPQLERLARSIRRSVERRFAADAVARQWKDLLG
jgi:glycosyltransferase involved in cell wall biosynthesis